MIVIEALLYEVLYQLKELNRKTKKGFKKMNAQVAAFKTAVDEAFATVNSNLDNIVADEAALAQQITDLQTQLANSGLSTEDTDALQAVVDSANAMAARTKSVADAIPDTVAPPTP